MKTSRRSTPKGRSGCLTCKCFSPYNIPFRVPGSQADRELLHFYCCEAAQSLSSLTDPTLWTQLVLQRCHTQPIIRHALVTLSALYRDHCDRGPQSPETQRQPSPRSLELIAKSHRQVCRHLSSPHASYEVALICGVLFYAFETLIGEAEAAIRHLDQTLLLFRRYRDDDAARPGCRDGHPVADDLLPHLNSLLARLDIQASMYNDTRPLVLLLGPSSPELPSDPTAPSPTDLNAKERTLITLQARLLRHLMLHVSHKNHPLDSLPPSILHERRALDADFQTFIASLTVHPAPPSSPARPIPQMHTHIQMHMQGPTKPQQQHQRLLLYRIQAQLSHSIIRENMITSDDDNDDDDEQPSPFTLSTQLIAGLYFICLKSHDPRTVDDALLLLQKNPRLPRREGLWDAGVVAKVVEGLREKKRAYEQRMEGLQEKRDRNLLRLEDVGEEILDAEGVGGVAEVLDLLKFGSKEDREQQQQQQQQEDVMT
ncbi:hypothetical protein ASPACDRAFT_1877402 [Aspergillus aculeatus ATCC 16872]|uniref:Zn(II)2Cys6 transcription factor n=1 Tax=Aspergillus aculeatus (strain ATCC 16872 / CBS 172.66 / WB 5094) TaxID=690307 RepID=A0A1L9WET2_ASPA1|nr:uncharacterized protein ASPACDRAFT_1877402 [Aspergillus aculeatus ATCC 16872]OJJ94692.1 hypothetical protein ASPACDRAFT_1877402 [Aspergillus aculeatus ATCC 16872]